MELYHEALRVHREELDSLNVFPVPDGDTGTNLLFTQRAVIAALGAPNADVNVTAAAALRAARGNSGVILAAVLRALVDSLEPDAAQSAGSSLADALEAADRAARHTVVDPKEGTALTVLREAAEGARSAGADGTGDAADVAANALARASYALAETTQLRPELRRAGVVDAGGLGMALLIDCLRAALSGDRSSIPVGPYGPVGRASPDGSAGAGDEAAFEVQFIVHADEDSIERLRRELSGTGTSLAVSGDAGTYAVHLHTDDPDRALAAATAAGPVEDQAVRRFDARPDGENEGAVSGALGAARTGVVAVANGQGLHRVFASLGATIVTGGPGSNPSVGALQAALEATGLEGAILLPNHPNVLPAARAAVTSANRLSTVVEALSVPAGLAAAAAYRPDARLSENESEMSAAAAAVSAGEVSIATIDVDTEAGSVRAGEWFAAIGDSVLEIGDEPASVARRLVERLVDVREGAELITVVLGDGAPSPEADAVCRVLRDAWPALRVEPIVGGQPHHRYLIGVE